MVYSEKAQECKTAAELCYSTGLYGRAASAYYYCLFLRAKGILAQGRFDYKGFLRESEHLSRQQRGHRDFAHSTIHIALAEYLNFDVEEFITEWNIVYSSRLIADYKDQRVTEERIDNCRKSFYYVYRRLSNGQIY